MNIDTIQKLKEKGLTGRGGAGFPTWQKWQAVKEAKSDLKFVICNGSEGEPFVSKDKFILENWPDELINGIKIALETIDNSSAFIYLNKSYYQEFKEKLADLIGNLPIKLFEKPPGYLAGEETTLLNIIEGKKAEPRIKPPFPTESGLWGKTTLINNIETFYWVSKIAKNDYKGNRFYTIAGEAPNPGVFELPENYTIEQVLKETANYPLQTEGGEHGQATTDYFFQVGGGASGAIMLAQELNQPITKTAACIIIFNKANTDPLLLMKGWAEFFIKENCDQCLPCREGIYRINEVMQKALLPQGKLDIKTMQDIIEVLEKTSFCPLGRMVALPFKTAIEKLF